MNSVLANIVAYLFLAVVLFFGMILSTLIGGAVGWAVNRFAHVGYA